MTLFEQMVWSATYAATINRFVGQADGEKLISLAIDDADEAILGLRSFVEEKGRLHLDEGLEAERRAALDLPEPLPVESEDQGCWSRDHHWVDRDDYKVCTYCGMVKQAKGNKPCKGNLPKIGLREEPEQGKLRGE